jgi:hypothetical protein
MEIRPLTNQRALLIRRRSVLSLRMAARCAMSMTARRRVGLPATMPGT